MMEYTLSRLAQREHELMVESLRPVPEHGSTIVARLSGWLAGPAGRLLSGLGNEMQALGARLSAEHRSVLQTPVRGQLER